MHYYFFDVSGWCVIWDLNHSRLHVSCSSFFFFIFFSFAFHWFYHTYPISSCLLQSRQYPNLHCQRAVIFAIHRHFPVTLHTRTCGLFGRIAFHRCVRRQSHVLCPCSSPRIRWYWGWGAGLALVAVWWNWHICVSLRRLWGWMSLYLLLKVLEYGKKHSELVRRFADQPSVELGLLFFILHRLCPHLYLV